MYRLLSTVAVLRAAWRAAAIGIARLVCMVKIVVKMIFLVALGT